MFFAKKNTSKKENGGLRVGEIMLQGRITMHLLLNGLESIGRFFLLRVEMIDRILITDSNINDNRPCVMKGLKSIPFK